MDPAAASQPPTVGSRHSDQFPAILLAVATTALAILIATLLGIRWRQPAYAMPVWVVGMGGVCAVLTGIGGAIAARRGALVAWLAPTVTLLVLLGFLEAGVLVLLPLIVVIAIVANRRAHGLAARSTRTRQWGAALLLTVGLVPLCLLALLGGPIIECTPQGIAGENPIWTWLGGFGVRGGGGGSFSGSSWSSTPNETSGSVSAGGTTYAYVCVGTNLVHFEPETR